ncbi:MAG: MmgE/PrpD family protein [Myxococcales bacterium]|nr:MmgE/PrpD family protein [Myxococcales bacterium]
MSVVEELAEFVCGLGYDDVPARVRELTKAQTASVLAAIFAGQHSVDAAAVKSAALTFRPSGEARVIPTGERVGVRDAILINNAYSMALDYDDYLYMGHTGHSAVLVALALGEAEGHSARDVLTAQVAGNEIGGRVGASAVLGPQNGQAWSFIHAIIGAVVASKLWKLSRAETAHALAIALYQPTFTLWPGFMGPGSKVLTSAHPSVVGVEAAAFARAGMTGAREIFEHRRKGFWASFTYAPLPKMLGGLGEAWVSDTLAFKRYPGCAYIDTTLDALFAALAEFRHERGRALAPEEVRRIVVDASLLTVEMDNLSSEHVHADEPLSPVNINFSIPFNVGIAIAAGKHDGAALAQTELDARAVLIRELAAKTELRHDWGMSLAVVRAFDGVLGGGGVMAELRPSQALAILAGYQRQLGGAKRTGVRPAALMGEWSAISRMLRAARRRASSGVAGSRDFTGFRMVFPAEVTLETNDGRSHRARKDVPLGAPGLEGRAAVAHDKLVHEAQPRLSPEGAARLSECVRNLELAPIAALVDAACGR